MITKKQLVVVSTFDGLSGLRIALDRTSHIDVVRYYSIEIDKYAIKVADHNYPQDTQYRLGDITKIDGVALAKEIRSEFGNVDILLGGGSPCQGFSMAGKLKGSSTKCGKEVTTLNQYLTLKEMGFGFDGQSYLFWEYVRLKEEINPTYFFLENVRITKKWLPMFNDTMGVEPVLINSSLVSGQNRARYYWVGEKINNNTSIETNSAQYYRHIDVSQPKDLCITMQDIMEDEVDNKFFYNKRFTLTGKEYGHIIDIDIKGNDSIKRVYSRDYKCPTLTTMEGGHRQPKVFIDDFKEYVRKNIFRDADQIATPDKMIFQSIRKLTPLECERLQTLDDNYTLLLDADGKQIVSDSQRYKMIGNGWTIDVVSHILNNIK